jgi:hypothetical protein
MQSRSHASEIKSTRRRPLSSSADRRVVPWLRGFRAGGSKTAKERYGRNERTATLLRMRIDFRYEELTGFVVVVCVPNEEPARLGCPEAARGFPVCTATVGCDGEGYRALFGWVQLVLSTDNVSKGRTFEIDPFGLFEDIPNPYCWFGFTPTLFDAPWRPNRVDLKWKAQSFLCVTPLFEAGRRVLPLLGFDWGFDVEEEAIRLAPVRPLESEVWSKHVPYLSQTYDSWEFGRGFV